jgi:hypothetical protein
LQLFVSNISSLGKAARQLQNAAGPEIEAFELSEKPYDMKVLVDSAKRMIGSDK